MTHYHYLLQNLCRTYLSREATIFTRQDSEKMLSGGGRCTVVNCIAVICHRPFQCLLVHIFVQ